MKHMKRANIYQASNYNVTFNPAKVEAYSYKWWKFVSIIDGLVIFNNYRYSNSTSKHQSKVMSLMQTLNIKIDLELPVPRGLQHHQTLNELMIEAEEYLCDEYLNKMLKQDARNEASRFKRAKSKLESYLENEIHFRDYDIKPRAQFGIYNIASTVNQVVDRNSFESDISNAIESFNKDGFGKVIFYV